MLMKYLVATWKAAGTTALHYTLIHFPYEYNQKKGPKPKPPIYLHLIFAFQFEFEFDELDFFPSLNWIFLPAVACKIQVWNRLKIQFIKLDISNWRIVKIKFR